MVGQDDGAVLNLACPSAQAPRAAPGVKLTPRRFLICLGLPE